MEPKDLRRVPEVLIGVFFVVHVVDKPDDAPQFLVCAVLPGEMAHDGLDRQGVRKEAGVFYVLRKDRPGFFARGFAWAIVVLPPSVREGSLRTWTGTGRCSGTGPPVPIPATK